MGPQWEWLSTWGREAAHWCPHPRSAALSRPSPCGAPSSAGGSVPAVQRMATRWQVGPRDDWTSGRQRAGGCLDGAGALGQLPWCRGALPHRSFNSELSLNVGLLAGPRGLGARPDEAQGSAAHPRAVVGVTPPLVWFPPPHKVWDSTGILHGCLGQGSCPKQLRVRPWGPPPFSALPLPASPLQPGRWKVSPCRLHGLHPTLPAAPRGPA